MKKRQSVYDLYWYFAYERQEIFWRKKGGETSPWSLDPIFQEYKFCNSYRVNDRVSQFLLSHIIYNGKHYSERDVIFRILLFKLFNLESTWLSLEEHFKDVRLSSFDFEEAAAFLEQWRREGHSIYNDAYISCANKAYGYDQKHQNHLALLQEMFCEDHIDRMLLDCREMKEAFLILKRYPLIGDFMAYQLVTDLNYSPLFSFSEHSFTVAGPGAKRGIEKCFSDLEGQSYEDVIKWMYEHQEEEFCRLGYAFRPLLGHRKLQYIDCQNIFCELDKYCRVALPELKSNRVKIKKKYHPKSNPIDYCYPPKWKEESKNEGTT